MNDFVIFRKRETCVCMAEWLPAYERELLAVGEIKYSIDIFQLRGKAAASADTHTAGGAADLAQYSTRALRIARQMGAAGFGRPENWDGKGGGGHQHLVLVGCPHNGPARYQIPALNAGYNGLGAGGFGGQDLGPRYDIQWPLKTWQQGLAWQAAQEADRAKALKSKRKARLRASLLHASRSAEANDRKSLRRHLLTAARTAPLLGKVILAVNLWSLRKTYTSGKQIGKVPGKVAATLREYRRKHTGPGSR